MSEFSFRAGAAGGQGRIILIPDEHILCDTPLLLRGPESVPGAILLAWRDHFLAHIDDKFIPGWAAVLESLDTYQTRLVLPATSGYPPFLTPGRLSRHGHPTALSTVMHAKRLGAAYDKYVAAIDYLTTTGREAFEEKIRNSTDLYRDGEAVPIAATGAYITGILGAAVRQWFFLVGSHRFAFYKWKIDYTEGPLPPDPPLLKDEPKWNVARRHQNLLVQGACLALEQVAAPKMNDKLDQFLRDHLRPDYAPPPESFIRFEAVEGVLTIRTLIAFAAA